MSFSPSNYVFSINGKPILAISRELGKKIVDFETGLRLET